MQVALEEFADFENMHDTIYVRIANIPLQESIRDLRWVRVGCPGAPCR